MSLIYVLIASGEKVLCDYSPYHGTFEQISLKILSKVRPNTTASFEYSNSYIFYYLNSEGITYLCMTDLTTLKRGHFFPRKHKKGIHTDISQKGL